MKPYWNYTKKSSLLSGSVSWGEQSKQRGPDFPFSLVQGNTKSFPGQERAKIPSECSAFTPGGPPGVGHA